MSKKRGRPKKPPTERREQRLDLRVNGDEKASFKLAAEVANQDLSVWIRVVLQQAATEQLSEAEALRKG